MYTGDLAKHPIIPFCINSEKVGSVYVSVKLNNVDNNGGIFCSISNQIKEKSGLF